MISQCALKTYVSKSCIVRAFVCGREIDTITLSPIMVSLPECLAGKLNLITPMQFLCARNKILASGGEYRLSENAFVYMYHGYLRYLERQ